jgi:hypothetical protein
MLIARHGGRACHQGQQDHQEHRDFLGPGEGGVGEVAHQHIGKGDQGQSGHDDHGQPVFDAQGARLVRARAGIGGTIGLGRSGGHERGKSEKHTG